MDIVKTINEGVKKYNDGDYKGSISLYKKTLKLTTDSELLSKIHYNMGLSYYSLIDYKLSKNHFLKSLDYGNHCQWELCLVNFHLKDKDEALKYWPWRSIIDKKYPDIPLPKYYNLDDVKDKRILVLNEQGFGDEFLFSKIIPQLSKNCEYVKYQVYDETCDVLKELYKYDNVDFFTDRNFDLDFIKHFHGFILSGDLLKNIFDDVLDFNISDDIEHEYDYGLCWGSNMESKNHNDRKIDPYLFENMDLKGVSLQYDDVVDFLDEIDIDDFMDTFNIIKKCKVVITVDTSVLHLASLMGKKTYLLYDKYLDWRWNYKFYKDVEIINISELNIEDFSNKIKNTFKK